MIEDEELQGMVHASGRCGKGLENWLSLSFGKRPDSFGRRYAIHYFEHRIVHGFLEHERRVHAVIRGRAEKTAVDPPDSGALKNRRVPFSELARDKQQEKQAGDREGERSEEH